MLGGAPSRFACYRFAGRLGRNRDLIEWCAAGLVQALSIQAKGFCEDVAVDSTDLPAWANGQRYRYRGGPAREAWSDPDASWGHRSAVSTRKGGGFYGYKLHLAVCTQTGLPAAWVARPANESDMAQVPELLDRLAARGLQPATVAMDRGYDYRRTCQACEDRGALAVVAPRRNAGTEPGPIDRRSDRYRRLYRARAAVEREFGRLKHHLGLTPLRTRTLRNVQLHTDLTMIARLALALNSSMV